MASRPLLQGWAMHRSGLALALLLACAGRSPAESPDPADLEVPPELQVRSRRLVRKLGSADFAEREEAQKKLAALGRLARPALLEGANNSPAAEVRLRCAELLPAAVALDLRARVETFLADAEGRYEHDLPGWRAFRATAAGEWSFLGRTLWSDPARRKAAREVFARLIAAADNRRLMVAADGPRLELAELTAARRQDLSRRRSPRGEDERRRDPALEDATALLFAESLVGSQYAPRRGSASFLLSASGFYAAARGADEKGRVYRAVAAAWLRSRDEPREMYQAMNIAVSLDLTDESCAIAAKLVTMPGLGSPQRGRAAAHLAEYGAPRHATLLDPALAAATAAFTVRPVPADPTVYEIQLRDFALALSLLLSGQKPADYGFSDRDFRSPDVAQHYSSSRYYFRDDGARKKAFAKWAEWR
jgi:hypothetical protein